MAHKKKSALLLKLSTHPHTFTAVAILTATLFTILLTAISIEATFANRFYPITLAGQAIGGDDRERAAAKIIAAAENYLTQNLTIASNGTTTVIKPTDLGLSFDYAASLDGAWQVGHTGGPFKIWRERILALLGRESLPLQTSFGESKVKEAVARLAARVDRPPKDAAITISGGDIAVTTAEEGYVIDKTQLLSDVKTALGNLKNTLIVQPQLVSPKVTAQDAAAAAVEAKTALSAPAKLVWRDQSWNLNTAQIASLLTFAPEEVTVAKITIGGETVKINAIKLLSNADIPTGNPQLHLRLDTSKLTTYLDTISSSISQTAVDAKFQFQNGTLQVLSAEKEGRELDRDALAANLRSALTETSSRVVELPIKLTPPKVTASQINNLGIKDLLGRGTSHYAGSIPGRNFNIALSSSRVHGTLVPPGEVFSLYKTIGEVGQETGYALSYIIVGHRTGFDYGGGVCQISTTLFRAALAAGLPIVERHPHAFRVHYYELDSAAGLDATIYFPYSDFKFKNDTPGWVLIQTVNDPTTATLSFEFYGTSDGRQTTITRPVVTDITPAPAPLYQDDPTLPRGVTKQVDFANDGATAVFSRTVTRDGQAIIQDTYYTKYQPWQAIYLVGTKDG